jgi:hypothetical protein
MTAATIEFSREIKNVLRQVPAAALGSVIYSG